MDEILTELQQVEQEQLIVKRDISQAIKEHEQKLEQLKLRDDDLREKLLTAMEKSNIKSFSNDVLRISYVAPQIRTTVDVKRIKEEAPEVFEEFKKESYVKASLKISVYES